jgi:4,5-dihydroxyphthalate decarboxylase
MPNLPLTFACGSYDRTNALRTGEVTPEGIDLNYVAIEASRDIFDRFVGKGEFDCAELSASEFIRNHDAGDRTFVAVPIFPSRAFRHGFIFINRNAGIKSPKDLAGRRIGVGLWTQTAAVYIKGHLENEFGVDLSAVQWVQGAIEKPGAHGNPVTRPLLKPVDIIDNESPYSIADLLARGEIDALIAARRAPNYGIKTLMGGDPWPCGVEPNRSTLEALIGYMHQQHMIAKKMKAEDLFVQI